LERKKNARLSFTIDSTMGLLVVRIYFVITPDDPFCCSR